VAQARWQFRGALGSRCVTARGSSNQKLERCLPIPLLRSIVPLIISTELPADCKPRPVPPKRRVNRAVGLLEYFWKVAMRFRRHSDTGVGELNGASGFGLATRLRRCLAR